MSGRGVPFHCPYCGDENLWPHEGTLRDASSLGSSGTVPHGAWECRSCLRAFSLKMLGLRARPESAGPAGDPA